ncbi:MAG: toprim domain-containing protein [Candidatus Bathyarchaeota archaeon]|nr:toprim domain-containing protein [Candidatus Bathyarchaeota archaeon]
MSTHLKDKEEKILQVLEGLAEESAKGTPIIVEGKNDIDALRALGVEGKIISAKTGGKSILDVISEVEKCTAKEVIMLLDFDRRGKEWTKRLKQNLEKAKTKINITFWSRLLALVGTEVKDIEGLATYMETLKRKIHNS